MSLPQELKDLPQYLVWRGELDNEKLNKVPVNPRTGRRLRGRRDNPKHLMSFQEARTYSQKPGIDGMMFVVMPDGPLIAVDLDDCRNPETREIEPWAAAIVERLSSYTEISPSGRGLHIWVRAAKPGPRCISPKIKLPSGAERKMEMYGPVKPGIEPDKPKPKPMTMTGNHLARTPLTIEPRQEEIDRLYAEYFPQEDKPAKAKPGANLPVPVLTRSDEEVLAKARGAKNGEKFRKLYDEGDWKELGYDSQSEADQALCAMLAFWTGGNREQIDRLFRGSALYRSEKWERKDYRERTITNGIDYALKQFHQDVNISDLACMPPHVQEGVIRDVEEAFSVLWEEFRYRVAKRLYPGWSKDQEGQALMERAVVEEWSKLDPVLGDRMREIFRQWEVKPDKYPFLNCAEAFALFKALNSGKLPGAWVEDHRGSPLFPYTPGRCDGIIFITLEGAPGVETDPQLWEAVRGFSPETIDILLIILSRIIRQLDTNPLKPALVTCSQIADLRGVKLRDGSRRKLLADIERQVKTLAGIGLVVDRITREREVGLKSAVRRYKEEKSFVRFGTPDLPDRLIHLVEIYCEEDGKTWKAFTVRPGEVVIECYERGWLRPFNPALLHLHPVRDRLAKEVGLYLTLIDTMKRGYRKVTPAKILEFCGERPNFKHPEERTVKPLLKALTTLVDERVRVVRDIRV